MYCRSCAEIFSLVQYYFYFDVAFASISFVSLLCKLRHGTGNRQLRVLIISRHTTFINGANSLFPFQQQRSVSTSSDKCITT